MALTGGLHYFDNNATTRMDDAVLEAMLPFLKDNYGNAASRLHAHGWIAEAAVEKAAEQTATLIGCSEQELVFTSGATEAINLAIKGIFEAQRHKGRHLVTVCTEHKAVLDSHHYLKKYHGAEVTLLPVDREGLIDPDQLKASLRPDTLLVSVMAANNETGVKQDLERIAGICKENNTLFFCDATQLVGKERCAVQEIGVDALALSAHKFYGPKGSGALYLNRRTKIVEQMSGGGHQRGLRSGTLNVAGIVGLGKAAELALSGYWEQSAHISRLKNHLEHRLLDLEGLRINGSTRHRLYTTSNLSFPARKSPVSLISKFAFSSGSACSSASTDPSHVLTAMGLSAEEIKNSYRFSFGKYNSIEEVDMLVEAILAL